VTQQSKASICLKFLIDLASHHYSLLLVLLPRKMLSTCRSVSVLIAVTLVVLLSYAESPIKVVTAGSRAFKVSVNTFLRQILSENLPWSPLSVSTPTFASPHEHQGGLEASTRTKFTRHVVAVGDLHGDLSNARRVLQFSGVTDDRGDWSGNVDFFVQTGDIIDRYAAL